jgi:hypothetical protein
MVALELVSLSTLLAVVLVAVGMSFVVTGASIGKPLRIVAWLVLRRTRLDALARCPYCCAWWCGAAVALVSGQTWWQLLECAFASCGVAAVVQAQWGLAANEDFDAQRKEARELDEQDAPGA